MYLQVTPLEAMKLFKLADLKYFALSLMIRDGIPLLAKHLFKQPSSAAVSMLLHSSKCVILLEQQVMSAT